MFSQLGVPYVEDMVAVTGHDVEPHAAGAAPVARRYTGLVPSASLIAGAAIAAVWLWIPIMIALVGIASIPSVIGFLLAVVVFVYLMRGVERLERVSRRFELIGKPQALEPVEVREVIHELEHYFRPRLPKLGHGIRLRTRLGRGIPLIRANGVLLAWALENVVKNAIDALAGRGGKILVAAHAQGGEVHVHIADNGPGIDPLVRDRIFEPGVTTKAGGWGVGLSLTRRIVEELHGGRIVVRPRSGGGTVFDIVLPAAATATPARRSQWQSQQAISSS